MPRKKRTPADKRRELREAARGYFDAKRAGKEAYTDMALAAVIVDDKWAKAKPIAKLLVTETVAGWLAEMARSATEETRRDDQPDIPGMILYRDAEGARRRKSIKAATLAELRSYEAVLAANAAGANAELQKMRAMIRRAEAAGCGEDDDVWPYLSDEPRLPLGPAPGASHDPAAPSPP